MGEKTLANGILLFDHFFFIYKKRNQNRHPKVSHSCVLKKDFYFRRFLLFASSRKIGSWVCAFSCIDEKAKFSFSFFIIFAGRLVNHPF